MCVAASACLRSGGVPGRSDDSHMVLRCSCTFVLQPGGLGASVAEALRRYQRDVGDRCVVLPEWSSLLAHAGPVHGAVYSNPTVPAPEAVPELARGVVPPADASAPGGNPPSEEELLEGSQPVGGAEAGDDSRLLDDLSVWLGTQPGRACRVADVGRFFAQHPQYQRLSPRDVRFLVHSVGMSVASGSITRYVYNLVFFVLFGKGVCV